MIMAVMPTVSMVVVVPTHFGNVVHPDIMSRSSGHAVSAFHPLRTLEQRNSGVTLHARSAAPRAPFFRLSWRC